MTEKRERFRWGQRVKGEYSTDQELMTLVVCLMCGSRGGDRGSDPHLENHKTIGFLSNTGLDFLKNHKATKPAFNVRPSSAHQQTAISVGSSLSHQRNAIEMAFLWRANDGPL